MFTEIAKVDFYAPISFLCTVQVCLGSVECSGRVECFGSDSVECVSCGSVQVQAVRSLGVWSV